jgi:hypothetical protein
MTLRILFLYFLFGVASKATSQYTNSIELISKEIAAQASARQVSKLVILDITEGNVVSEYARSLSEELRIHMAINNASMVIIDRSVTEKIMDEQRLASSPLFDQSSAVSLGKLASADAILMGSLTTVAGENRIALKLVNTETGAVIGGYAGRLESDVHPMDEDQSAYALPTNAPPAKRLSFHAESSAGLQFVNQSAALGTGFNISRMKYRGDEKTSRFEKGKKGFLLGIHYFVGLPVKPNHDYTLGYRMVDNYGNAIRVNQTDIYQDSYFLIRDDADAIVTIDNSFQAAVPFQFYKAQSVRVDRLRIDLAWRYSILVNDVRCYAEIGLAYSRQFDRSKYSSVFVSRANEQVLNLDLTDNFSAPGLPAIVEVKTAVGAERGRWGLHLEGAITTRNRTYMSPLDMFHHPDLTQWSSMQADLADDGVGEITQKSASENWYYWLSSVIQLRYQL